MRFKLLDILRGFAALWVLLYHYPYSANLLHSLPILQLFVSNGFLGVSVFFVISGYCIALSATKTVEREDSSRLFLYRRFLRILPPFWCSIFVGVLIPYILTLLSMLKTGIWLPPNPASIGHSNFGIYDWIQVATLTRGFNWGLDDELLGRWAGFNTPYWSLAIEIQFYIVMFIAISLRLHLVWFTSIMIVLGLISMSSPRAEQWGIFVPFWPTFGFGCLVFFAPKTPVYLSRWVSCIGVVSVFCIASLCFLPNVIAARYHSLMMGLFVSFFLYWQRDSELVCFKHLRFVLRVPWTCVEKTLAFMGGFSYSIYLMHAKLFLIVDVVLRNTFVTGFARDLFGIFLTVISCFFFYLFFERPFLFLFKVKKKQ